MPLGNARVLHTQLTHFYRKRVNYNDAGISAGVLFGTMPAGALITRLSVRVNTAFNAGTTNALNMGTTGTGTQIFTDAATAGHRNPTVPNISFAADTDLFVSYAQTGTAASAGQADVALEYIPNIDQ